MAQMSLKIYELESGNVKVINNELHFPSIIAFIVSLLSEMNYFCCLKLAIIDIQSSLHYHDASIIDPQS